MTLEDDTKLVEGALESMKLNGAEGVDSPRVRRNEEQTAQIENSESFTSAGSTLYRSLVMKLAYVAQDRIDISEPVKCLTRHMKEPRSGHMQELKRLGRYLVKNRRCVLTYARQTSDATLQVHVDSDWAGDLLGRKSTTGVIVRIGKHLLRHMSCLQTLVAPTSGEAEYHALIRGACTSLGIQDWMVHGIIQINSDSSAGRSVCKKTWNRRTSETFADTTLVAAESSSSRSLELGCRCMRAESSRYTHETIARSSGQNMLVKDGCIEALARLNTS